MRRLTILLLLALLAGCGATSPFAVARNPYDDIDYVPVCEVHIKSTRCEYVRRDALFDEYEDNDIYGDDAH